MKHVTLFKAIREPGVYCGRQIFCMSSAFVAFSPARADVQGHAATTMVFDSCPVVSWIEDDEKSGFLIGPFDVGGMAGQIVDLPSQLERASFAEQSLEDARRFCVDRVGQTWQKLFGTEIPKHVERHEAETTA